MNDSNMIATDYLGSVLTIGDKVVYVQLKYRTLKTGYIMKITPCMVYIGDTLQSLNSTNWHKQSHVQVIKLGVK